MLERHREPQGQSGNERPLVGSNGTYCGGDKADLREIFGAARFSTFSTVSTQRGRSYAERPFELVTGKE
jgi:hypothetical protein